MKRSILPAALLISAAAIARGDTAPPVGSSLDADGTAHVPAFAIPYSALPSSAGKQMFIDMIRGAVKSTPGDIVKTRRDIQEQFHGPMLKELHELFAVSIKPETIAGVQTDVVTPVAGVSERNRSRVLVNLHGGGFAVAARTGGQVESIPIAGLGRIKVITVDYRQGPENKFPAASEDVAAVYRELLKTYEARNIGIYGCSAGGVLTAEALAWFQTHGLPTPGAAGVFGAGASAEVLGDSVYVGAILTGARPPAKTDPNPMVAYFGQADLKSPLASPVYAPEVLRKFPPTLVISSLRDPLLSSAVYTHTQLVKAGATANLHVWEGMKHCFFFSPRAPESREAWNVIVGFFDEHLAR